jgi:hypothetical protein
MMYLLMFSSFDGMGLYHPPDGVTNLKYKLLCFLIPNKKFSKRKVLAFNRDRCCHLALCLQLILFHYYIIESRNLSDIFFFYESKLV